MMIASLIVLSLSAADVDAVLLSPAGAELDGRWYFSDGHEFPGASGGATADAEGVVHLAYNFTGGGNYVGIYRTLDEPLWLDHVSCRLKKPAEAQVTVRATDSEQQTFQKTLFYDHADWQPIAFDMERWTGWWGGADDGVMRPPVTQIGFLIENKALESSTGEVLVADIQAVKGKPRKNRSGTEKCRGEYVVTDFGPDSGFGVSGGALDNRVWKIDFARTDRAHLGHSISLFGKPESLTFSLRGGAAGNVLKMQIGSHFQTFDRVLGTLTGGEDTFTVPVPPEGWSFSGGENDGKALLPLRVIGVELERGGGPAEPVEIELRGLRCTTTVRRSQAVTLLAHVEDRGVSGGVRTIEASCDAWNLLDTECEGALTVVVRDWEDRVLREEGTAWTLPASGVRTRHAWTVEIPAALNFADAQFRFETDAGAQAFGQASYTRPVDDTGDTALRPESPWGMGVYLYRYSGSPEGLAEMDRAASLAQAAGVKWSREEFSWARIETKPGEYDFSYYDQVVATAQRHGISVYGLLAYWSPFTQAYTEQGVEDFSRWARACVAHFKDRIKHWEIYNEPNIFFWSGPRELYPVLVKKCFEAIKAEDPEAQVLALSTAGIDRGFIEYCLNAGSPFDVLTIHPYRSVLTERGFVMELENTAKLVGNRPVWITEMGWSTQIGSVDERTQAQLLARTYLSAILSGACQNVSWYDFRDDGNDPFYNESNFGVLRNDMTPKPAYRALATVCRTLAQGQPTHRTDFGEDVYALQMGDALALWSPSGEARAVLRETSGTARVVNLMGDPVEPKRDGNIVTLELKPRCPLFLTGATIESAAPAEPASATKPPEVMEF